MAVTVRLDDAETDLLLLLLQDAIMSHDETVSEMALAIEARLVEQLPPPPATVPQGEACVDPLAVSTLIAAAILGETVLDLRYEDGKGQVTNRRIHPVILTDEQGYEQLVAWCERRSDYRNFRPERIQRLRSTGAPFPKRRRLMEAEWRSLEGFDDLF